MVLREVLMSLSAVLLHVIVGEKVVARLAPGDQARRVVRVIRLLWKTQERLQ